MTQISTVNARFQLLFPGLEYSPYLLLYTFELSCFTVSQKLRSILARKFQSYFLHFWLKSQPTCFSLLRTKSRISYRVSARRCTAGGLLQQLLYTDYSWPSPGRKWFAHPLRSQRLWGAAVCELRHIFSPVGVIEEQETILCCLSVSVTPATKPSCCVWLGSSAPW